MRTWLKTGALVALITLTTAGAAPAQEPDAALRADIEKLLQATGASALGAQMANLVMNSVLTNIRKTQPQFPERAVEVMRDVFSKEFTELFDSSNGVHGQILEIYAKHFTHEEIKGILAFYTSDLGRKAVKEMPALAQEGSAIGQQWATTNMPRIMGVLEKRLRDEKLIP